MRLFAVGISHRTAPVELRESVDFARDGVDSALGALAARGVSHERVVLSTCNRAEIYAAAEGDQAGDVIAKFLADYHGVDWPALAPHVFVRRGVDAAAHLFRVAAGLESLVVGEPQILGQVKDAFAKAADLKHTGAITNRLFTAAFTVGKRVRSETGLGEGAVSVSYAAIALARKIFGGLEGLSVLILGAGEMAKLTGVHLQAQRVRQLTIASRTLATAEALARELSGRAVPWTSLGEALAGADIVISATGATEPVLTRARIEEVMRPRRSRPLFIIDIALPRDVEAGVANLDQVFLYNIDDLQTIVKENMARRTAELDHADRIVARRSRAVHGLDAVARDHSDGRCVAAAVRGHPAGGALAARVEAVRTAAGGARPCGRNHPSHRREAAADADRAAQVGQRRIDGRRVLRRAEPAVQPGLGSSGHAGTAAARTESLVMRPLKLGTRGSQLALWQARTVAAGLEAHGHGVGFVIIRTSGDHLQEVSLSEAGGKGLFVKEIEDALHRGEIDLAVHSAKDMPAVLPDGFAVAATLPREDSRDALVLPGAPDRVDIAQAVARIGDSPTIGTSSVRRIAQLATLLPRARFVPIRGNVDTRLRKLDAGGFDALVLAAAGMRRLGFAARITAPIPHDDCIPAPGQGIVAIEIRADDRTTREAAATVNDRRGIGIARRGARARGRARRRMPASAGRRRDSRGIATFSTCTRLSRRLDGRRSIKRDARGPASDAAALGRRVADALADAGAAAILDEVRSAQGPVEGSY